MRVPRHEGYGPEIGVFHRPGHRHRFLPISSIRSMVTSSLPSWIALAAAWKIKRAARPVMPSLRTLMDQTVVLALDETTIDQAATLAIRCQLSHWDALIVAVAMLAGCETLYSEDLQHGQISEELLTS